MHWLFPKYVLLQSTRCRLHAAIKQRVPILILVNGKASKIVHWRRFMRVYRWLEMPRKSHVQFRQRRFAKACVAVLISSYARWSCTVGRDWDENAARKHYWHVRNCVMSKRPNDVWWEFVRDFNPEKSSLISLKFWPFGGWHWHSITFLFGPHRSEENGVDMNRLGSGGEIAKTFV